MTLNFTHLHAHSTYSFLDGFGTPRQILDRIEELGQNAVAITDHGSIFAHVPYARTFRKSSVKPIFGVEAYIVDNIEDRSQVQESLGASAFPHITLLAKNIDGYHNLLKLNRMAYEKGFYYKPRIDHKLLIEHSKGLIVLSGCPTGYPSRYLSRSLRQEISHDEAFAQCFRHMRTLRDQLPEYYVEIVPQPGYDVSHWVAETLLYIARELQIPAVITADAHFPRPQDWEAQDTLLSVGLGKKRDDPARTLRLPPYQYYCSAEEVFERATIVMPNTPHETIAQAINNSSAIASLCDVEIPRATSVVFPDIPHGATAESVLWSDISNGFNDRWNAGEIPEHLYQEYWTRAVHEYGVLKSKGFCDYILAITDVVLWVKKQGGLVVLRGSAGGCLLLWLINASVTDPIKHELSFERFYDETRPDPPDVDIDFEKAYRNQAFDYIFEKYGRENSAQIATLNKLKAKAALQDAAFSLGIPRYEYAPLSNALDSSDPDIDRQLSDITDPAALAILDRHPKLRIFEQLIGQCRQSSVHAAGVVVSGTPLDKLVGIVLGSDKQPVATVDKYSAADMGFLKMDFLSVEALDKVGRAMRRARGTISELDKIPLNDPHVLAMANRGALSGIFQLDGGSAARVAKEIGIDTFDDLVAASALCRPGPGDWVQTYTRFKRDAQSFNMYLQQFHPAAANVVKNTFGILLYQEQVTKLAVDLAGISISDSHKLRKAITSSAGLDEWRERFVNGCTVNGVSAEEADHWWRSISTHGSYSFNRAHCVTYGIISYWMLWLKTYYPAQFFESSLSISNDPFTMKRMIREYATIGGQVELLDPQHSSHDFTVVDKRIIGGYSSLKGIGPANAKKIVTNAPYDSWEAMLAALPKSARDMLIHRDDPTYICQVAPWFPVDRIHPLDETTREQYGGTSPKYVVGVDSVKGDFVLCGYVTIKDVKPDRVFLMIEDDRASLVARAGRRSFGVVHAAVGKISVGDYVITNGSWFNNSFYMNDVAVLRSSIVKKSKDEKSKSERPKAKPRAKRVEPPVEPIIRYWCHSESDSLWTTSTTEEAEAILSGQDLDSQLTVELTKEEYEAALHWQSDNS